MVTGVFWDLDGTLLSTGGRGWPCMIKAAGAKAPVRVSPRDVSGLSDVQILSLLSRIPVKDLGNQFEIYLNCLDETLSPGMVTALPSASSALIETRRLGFVSAIVTGNLKEGAKVKLSSSGLLEKLAEFQIFGSSKDLPDREAIANSALDSLGIDRAIFVGDSVNDVETARKMGMPCIAVATGHHTRKVLEDAGASHVFDQGFSSDQLLQVLHLLVNPVNQ